MAVDVTWFAGTAEMLGLRVKGHASRERTAVLDLTGTPEDRVVWERFRKGVWDGFMRQAWRDHGPDHFSFMLPEPGRPRCHIRFTETTSSPVSAGRAA
jgi:hypothetical protein